MESDLFQKLGDKSITKEQLLKKSETKSEDDSGDHQRNFLRWIRRLHRTLPIRRHHHRRTRC